MARPRNRFSALWLMIALLLPVEGWAAAFSISPTRVQMAPGQKAGVLTLTNNGEESVTVQVEAFAWTRTENVADLDPTRDVIAVPPFFEIEGGAKQIIRVGLRNPQVSDQELAYRLLISEVPKARNAEGLGVQFALRISLPVFITPSDAEPNPDWKLDHIGNAIQVEAANHGNAHVRLLSLTLKDANAGATVGKIEDPVYLLAGQKRTLSVPLERVSNIGAGTNLVVVAETVDGSLEFSRVVR